MASIFEPMLCGETDAVPASSILADWLIQPKLDGWRVLTVVREDGGMDFIVRSGTIYGGNLLPYISTPLLRLPAGTILDGELIGSEWGSVQSVMGSHGVHVPTERSPMLTFVAFDAIRHGDEDLRRMPLLDRLDVMRNMVTSVDHPQIQPCPTGPASQEAHDDFLRLGMEGSVVKRADSRYFSGQRVDAWRKIKRKVISDAIVTGFKAGKGELTGLIGAIEFRLVENGVESRCSGMDEATRLGMTQDPDWWIGQTIEVRHNGLMKSGKPRHPRYFRLRDARDLSPA